MTDWTPETLATELVRMAPAESCADCADALHDVCQSLRDDDDWKPACDAYRELLALVQAAERERTA